MARRLRARPSNTMLLVIGAGTILLLLAVAGLNKPLPSYLVATGNLPPGAALTEVTTQELALDLGILSDKYATRAQVQNKVLLQPVAIGELIPVRILGEQLSANQTSIRFTPKLKPANPISLGARVAIWQAIELDEEYETQVLVQSALVTDLVYGEGLFAGELPEVEVVVSNVEAQLLLAAISAEHDVYLLPKS